MTHPLLKPPGGVFVLAGLALLAAFPIDYLTSLLNPADGAIYIGWGPVFSASSLIGWLAPGVHLLVLGVIIFHLGRISAQLRARADGGGG
jgi:hypothetical protein